MKRKTLIGLIAGALMLGSTAFTLMAQDAPKRSGNGSGYGGPPANQEERAARQAACLKANNGVCPNGGPRQECRGRGKGKGKAQGARCGARRGLRDGTGPRTANGICPVAKQSQPKQ